MGIKLNLNDIKRILDGASVNIDSATANRLLAVRRSALQHQQTKRPTIVLAWLSEHGIIDHANVRQHKALNWGLSMLLAAILVGGASYYQIASEHDQSEIDIAILTDDLPVHMYVD